MTDPSKGTRTTSSKSKLKINPGEVDDLTTKDLKGFKQAKNTREDPAYRPILNKCSAGSMMSHGTTITTLVPPQDKAYDDLKDWNRGKKTEQR